MKMNVAVFMGGKSCEHEISCISASQVIKALDEDKYEIIPIYIAKNNDMYTGSALMDISNFADNIINKLEKVCIYKDGSKVYVKPINGLFKKAQCIDVAFEVVHGTNVEDGTLAGYLEMLDIPYTGSDVLGSAVGQDKAIMKEIFEHEKIKIVDWFYILAHDYDLNEVKKKASKIGYPLIIKPANLGSSVGIEVVHGEEELEEKIKECAKYDFKLVIEKMVTKLKEVNISVMGSIFEQKLSAIEEVYKDGEFLDFTNKYEKGSKGAKGSKTVNGTKVSKGMASTSRKVPADITASQKKKVETMALKAFKALNAKGAVRIDFIIDEETGEVYVNEINSIPGSLAFYLWSEVGIDFSRECDELIQNALKMYREKQKKTYSFDTNILSSFKKRG